MASSGERRARTVMVTGGAGFIGRSVGARPAGRRRARAHRRHGARTPAAGGRGGARPAPRSSPPTSSTAPLRELLLGVDAVVHLAGRPGVQPSWGGGFDEYVRHNVSVTQRLLEAVGARRIVVASSSSVYGEVADGLRHRGRAAAAAEPVRRLQGGDGDARPRLRRPRRRRRRPALLQRVRPPPAPRHGRRPPPRRRRHRPAVRPARRRLATAGPDPRGRRRAGDAGGRSTRRSSRAR